MNVSLYLKYAARQALKRQPRVLRLRDALIARERAQADQLEERQEQLLARTFEAAARIPAYAAVARRAPARRRLAWLRKAFPIIDKRDLVEQHAAYYPHAGLPRPWWPSGLTSGTSGMSVQVIRCFNSITWEEAFHLQHWHWAGWKPGDRQAVLRGDLVVPLTQKAPPYWVIDPWGRQLILSTRHLNEDTVGLFAEAVRRFGATQLRAYPSAAFDFATAAAERGLELRFRSIITGSELLHDFQRRRIEAVFGAKVYDFYSMAERVAFAMQCEHGRLHAHPEYAVVEIVDEDGFPTQGEGRVVGTTLHNRLMPLIRYRVDDIAQWSRERCPCGRTYPVIEKVNGRLADVLFDLFGRSVNPTVVAFAFDGVASIMKAQVAQTAADLWTVRVVPGPGFGRADVERLLANFYRFVSADVHVDIELLTGIPPLPSGKYKLVSQEWYSPGGPLPQPASPHRSRARPIEGSEARC